jgi:uncharacterized protein
VNILLRNITQNKIISNEIKIADNFFKRAKGLMFSSKKSFNYSLIFNLERNTIIGASIHMFFVFFKINLIFLNENKEIIEIKKNLKPFQIYNPKNYCRYIIELPVDFDIKYLNIGDILTWD